MRGNDLFLLLTIYFSIQCNRGFEKMFGRCEFSGNHQRRPDNFDPFVPCADSSSCLQLDMNLVCNTNLTVQTGGKCECRKDMRWNKG